MKIKKWLALSVGSLCVANANADVSLPCGWYAEGNIGYVHVSGVDFGPGASTNTKNCKCSFGENVNLGFKFIPYFAAEVGFTHYPDLLVQDPFGDTAATDKTYSVDIASKAILPFGDCGVELFAKVGLARLHSSISINDPVAASFIGVSSGSKTGCGAYYGIGIDWSCMPCMPVNIQWQHATGGSGTGNRELISIGIAYMAA